MIGSRQSGSIIPILFSFSFFTSIIFIDTGFALKLFMPFALFIFAYLLIKGEKGRKIEIFEMLFIAFVIYAMFVSISSEYSLKSLRMGLGSIIIFFSYYVHRVYVCSKYFSLRHFQNSLIWVGMFFSLSSLLMYLFGLWSIEQDFASMKNITIFGLMIDRGIPRLSGLAGDPNIYTFYVMPFFFILLHRKNKNLFEIGVFLLILLTIALTVSRAGILTTLLITLFVFFYRIFVFKLNFQLFIKLTLYVLFFFTLVYYSVYSFDFSFIEQVAEKRINSVSTGSGRFEIWMNAIELWLSNPFFGIGWYNFLEYNVEYFNRHNYVHNTFLEVLVELGVFGLFFYAMFHWFIFLKIISAIKIDNSNAYLMSVYIGFIMMMNSLSLIINEVFFFFLSVLLSSVYLSKLINSKNT